MSDINWDLAPEGAVELVRNGFRIAYRDKAGNTYLSTGWEYSESWDLAEIIATRPQQTKTVTDEQEGEKWTHKLGHGNCRIKFEEADEFGYVLIELEGQGYKLYKPSQLKPIKPKLTESAMLSRIAELARGTLSDAECGDKIRELFDTVEII